MCGLVGGQGSMGVRLLKNGPFVAVPGNFPTRIRINLFHPRFGASVTFPRAYLSLSNRCVREGARATGVTDDTSLTAFQTRATTIVKGQPFVS